MMRVHLILVLQYLLPIMVILVGQTFAQEDTLGFNNSTTNTTTGNETTDANSTLPILNTTLGLEPTLSPFVELPLNSTSSPTQVDNENDNVTLTTMPTSSPTMFLLIRPLHNIQVRLFGTYNSSKREELLEVLQSVLEKALYLAMVDYFVPESDKKQLEKQRQQLQSNNLFDHEQKNKNNGTVGVDQEEQPLPSSSLSILSKVSLEWTVTNFTVDRSPWYHILQASGTLGFSDYDYTLLQPQTILPLQSKVMTTLVDLEQIDLAMKKQNFHFQTSDFIPVEGGTIDEPTASPTVWELLLDDDTMVDGNSGNSLSDRMDEQPEYEESSSSSSSSSSKSVSKATIRTALIVACVVSAIAFGIFVKYLRLKTQQIKKNRLSRKQQQSSMSSSRTMTTKINVEDDDKAASCKGVSPIMTDESVSSTSSSSGSQTAAAAAVPLSLPNDDTIVSSSSRSEDEDDSSRGTTPSPVLLVASSSNDTTVVEKDHGVVASDLEAFEQEEEEGMDEADIW
eukprot:CAMPEP_0113632134 /NCGR_PEP_ID=MMETSP0017_2-20120614/16699_1 /TAXON_ID=2856 /ORGANISM="Cylindrotheca closterium" /LENGTH=508 /DNA_ID=CAMNT_0000542671 /DNA_START=92 /DNA_END=1615 /DNA_ORIENTATION=+ /assembly_acc=CAM_ASM_000147